MKDYYINVNSSSFIGDNNGQFMVPECIYISNNLVPPEEFRVLFHELRHYFQFRTGMYEFQTKTFYRELPPDMTEAQRLLERYLEYKQLPCERDANEFAMETIRKFWKDSVSLPHRLGSDLYREIKKNTGFAPTTPT